MACEEVGNSSARDSGDQLALVGAIQARQVDVVVDLLKRGASANVGGRKGLTPLHFACLLPSEEEEEEKGEEPAGEAHNRDGDKACDDRTVSIIQALLANGADIDKLDDDERTPLITALNFYPASSANIRAAITLIDAGADLEIYWGNGSQAETSVSLAVDVGDVDLWKAIIRRGTEMDVSNASGTMPLGFAAENDRVDLMELLVDGGANVSARVAHDDEYPHEYGPMTPLLIACLNLQLRATRCLLNMGADVEDRTLGDGDTCLHLVAPELRPRPGQAAVEDAETAADLVELLLEWDADESAKNYSRETPADVAKAGHLFGTRGPYDDQLGLNRGQLLLLNAPREKAWRRRKLLVLCRTHPTRVRLTLRDAESVIDRILDERLPGLDRINAQARTFAQHSEHLTRAVRRWRKSQNIRIRQSLPGALARLMDLREEELFRRIVGYL